MIILGIEIMGSSILGAIECNLGPKTVGGDTYRFGRYHVNEDVSFFVLFNHKKKTFLFL